MKVSELITKLEEILRTEGDLPVTCWPYDGQGRYFELAEVEARELSPAMYPFEAGGETPKRVVSLDA